MEEGIDKKRILIVDDEIDIREILQYNLQYEGYDVDLASSAEEALEVLQPNHKLILLDVMMGGMSGFKFADEIRKKGNNIPIIFLTAKNTENDMLTGFSIGGDDYISKPFSIKEVIARVKSVIKRSEKAGHTADVSSSTLTFNNLVVNLDLKTVFIDGQNIELTKTEYDILVLFVKNEEKIFTRNDILSKVWKDNGIVVVERTVDVHITRLRKKLGEYGKYITNRTGYGYIFKTPEKS